MKNIVRALTILAVVGSLMPFANATGNPKCKDCGMVLSSKKDKGHTVAVKMGKKTYYCCAGCAMNKKTPVKKGK